MPALRKLHPLFAREITGLDLTEKKFIEEAMDRYAVAVLATGTSPTGRTSAPS